jgi:hypothetical protein
VLRQKRFVYRTHPMGELEELPADFHRFLKASLSKATAQVEDKVWEGLLDKKTKAPKSSQDRLSLWAGWMQIILLYRDVAKTNGSEGISDLTTHSMITADSFAIESWFNVNMQRKAESLMNCAAVMYDLHFGKRKPTTSVDGMNTAMLFRTVESQQVEFRKSSLGVRINSSKSWPNLVPSCASSPGRPGFGQSLERSAG